MTGQYAKILLDHTTAFVNPDLQESPINYAAVSSKLSRTNFLPEFVLDIDECNNANPCPPNSQCENFAGGYECLCNEGYANATGSCYGKYNKGGAGK